MNVLRQKNVKSIYKNYFCSCLPAKATAKCKFQNTIYNSIKKKHEIPRDEFNKYVPDLNKQNYKTLLP